jgi:hypothetical protein
VPRARAHKTGAWAGRTARRSRAPSAGIRRSLKTRRHPKNQQNKKEKEKFLLTNWPTGSMANAHRAVSSLRPTLRSMARHARVAAYSRGKRSGSSRNSTNAMGFALSSISKMQSRLSIRGTIRRWWRLARTHPAVNPRPPGALTQPGASPAAPGARAGTPRGARSRPSPSALCRCRGGGRRRS